MRIWLITLLWLVLPVPALAEEESGPLSPERLEVLFRDVDRGTIRSFEPAEDRDGAYLSFVVLEYPTPQAAAATFEPLATGIAGEFPSNQRVTSDPGYGERSITFSGPTVNGETAIILVRDGIWFYLVAAIDPDLGAPDLLPDLLEITDPMFSESSSAPRNLLDRLPRLMDLPAGYTMTQEGERDVPAAHHATPAATPVP